MDTESQLERLMLTPEHFPLEHGRLSIGKRMPPVPSSLMSTGIDADLVLLSLPKVAEHAAGYMEAISSRHACPSFERVLNIWSKGLQCEPQIYESKGQKIITPIPISGSLLIEGDAIEDLCKNSMRIKSKVKEFPVSKPFSEEIMREYGMHRIRKGAKVSAPYHWTYKQNHFSECQFLFYKSLALALNNEAVRRKYIK